MENKPETNRVEKNRNPRRDGGRLSSVTTAVHLMKTFSEEDQELGISELAKRLGVAKSTVHRLACALLDEGLLQQNPENGRYRLGVGLFMLGALVRARLDVASESKVILTKLRDELKENVRLAVLERDNVVFLHDFESPQAVRIRSKTGQMRPAFCTAEGICLLAGLREPQLTAFFDHPRVARTKNTITDEETLRANIRKVKRKGYYFEDEECDAGTRSVAAPVFFADGTIAAAIGVSGPRSRLRKSQIDKLARRVMEAADEISLHLGYGPRERIYI
ncbi:IclR family transcriptional regulator [Actibacterium sp. MT2.3-13A]|uniref:IclR family transcriptional regulator n=1 Tax=Actibacterium sp. MT2.3-13A TaxID=2828332 RepID=UPI001BA813F9|nr:IclR family transcriptional regulator [Actibacterium sp. MT2.3-13A]